MRDPKAGRLKVKAFWVVEFIYSRMICCSLKGLPKAVSLSSDLPMQNVSASGLTTRQVMHRPARGPYLRRKRGDEGQNLPFFLSLRTPHSKSRAGVRLSSAIGYPRYGRVVC